MTSGLDCRILPACSGRQGFATRVERETFNANGDGFAELLPRLPAITGGYQVVFDEMDMIHSIALRRGTHVCSKCLPEEWAERINRLSSGPCASFPD